MVHSRVSWSHILPVRALKSVKILRRTDVVILGASVLSSEVVSDGVRVEPRPRGLRLDRTVTRPAVVPLLGRREAPTKHRVYLLLPQHHVTFAVRTGLGACAAVVLVLFGLAEHELQVTVGTRDEPLRTLGALEHHQDYYRYTQDSLKKT